MVIRHLRKIIFLVIAGKNDRSNLKLNKKLLHFVRNDVSIFRGTLSKNNAISPFIAPFNKINK